MGGSGSGSGNTINSVGAHCAYMTYKQCKKSNNCYLVGGTNGVCVHGVDPNMNNGDGGGGGGGMVQLNGGSTGGGECARLNKQKCRKSRKCTYKRSTGCTSNKMGDDSKKKKKKKKKEMDDSSRLRVVPADDNDDEYDYEYAISPAAAIDFDDTQYLQGEEEETQYDDEQAFAYAAAAIDDSTTLEPSSSSSSYQEEEDGITLCVTGPNSYELSQLDPNHPTSDCGPTSFCYLQPPTSSSSSSQSLCPTTEQPSYGICKSKPTTCTEEYVPVCGCDGLVHGNVCMAHREGVNVEVSLNDDVDVETTVCGSGVGSSINDKDINDEHEVVNEEGEVSLLPISPHDMPSLSVLECTTNDDCSNGLTCHVPSRTCACNTVTNEGCHGGEICTSNPPGLYCYQYDNGECLPTCTCDYNSPFPAMYVSENNNEDESGSGSSTTTNGCNVGEVCRQPCAMADAGPHCFASDVERDCNIYGTGYGCRSKHGGMGCILLEDEEDDNSSSNNNDDCSTKNNKWHESLIPGVSNTCTNDNDYPDGWEKLDGFMYESSKECCIGNEFGNALECIVVDVCSSIEVVQSDGEGGGEDDSTTTATTGATIADDKSTSTTTTTQTPQMPLQDCLIEGHCHSPSGICGPRVQCLTNPCDNTTCEDGQVCESQNCGGCHAICVVSTSSTSVIPSGDATSTVVTSTTSTSSSSSSKIAYWYPEKDDITHTKRCTYDANYPDEYVSSSIQELLSLSEDECCQNYPEACQHQHTIGPIVNKEVKWYPHEFDNGTRTCAYDSDYPTEYTNPEHDPPILFDDEVDCCVAFDVCQNGVSTTTSSSTVFTTTATSVTNDTETTNSTVGATAKVSAYSTTCEWHISTEPYVHNTCTNSGE